MKLANLQQFTRHVLLLAAAFLSTTVATGFAANIEDLNQKAEAGDAQAQYELGRAYDKGKGVDEDDVEAARWYSRAGKQGHAKALYELGHQYFFGSGKVPFDRVRAYAYWDLAAARGHFWARGRRNLLSRQLSRGQIVAAMTIGQQFMAGGAQQAVQKPGKGHGTGFFISGNGFLVTNHHVVEGASTITVIQRKKRLTAKVIAMDPKNDLAILKVDGNFDALPVVDTTSVKLGLSVLTVGHPLSNSLGNDPTLTKGIVSRLSGFQGNKKELQVSAQIQPGSSGSGLVNEKGEVIGVMQSSLVATKRVKDVPQNINFAIKSDQLLKLIQKHPEVSKALKKGNAKAKPNFQKAVETAVKATVLLETKID
ncbi:tetratricopeptide repeat-containing serine protease family protein [Planctomycetaceae bacterium]|nr:tetratricopeptide repeat-containing serine protease family protein [Planctomycetaceae bacterium]